MRRMSIGEVASQAGVRPSTIRYYEKLGVLPKAARVSGRRQYDDAVVERLAIVRFAKQVGFTMDEVRDLVDGIDRRPPPERWRELARRKLAEVAQFITDAKAIKKMLADSLAHQCPRLVERGRAVVGQRGLSRRRPVGRAVRA
jgi:MerR family redox-sensitive transcriptional activator SoxR